MRLLMMGDLVLACGGIPIVAGDTQAVLHARLSIALSDGDGIRDALNWRGASSMKRCWFHDNVVKQGSGPCLIVAPWSSGNTVEHSSGPLPLLSGIAAAKISNNVACYFACPD